MKCSHKAQLNAPLALLERDPTSPYHFTLLLFSGTVMPFFLEMALVLARLSSELIQIPKPTATCTRKRK